MRKVLQRLTVTLFYCGIISFANAQSVAINTDGSSANSSAILDVKSATKGILIPRMSKTERNAIASPATGLMVFQSTPDSVGFYYYDGSSWAWIQKANAGWSTTGNTGTTPGTNFIGTTDAKDLVVKTQGNEAMRVDPTGNVGIGNNAPSNKLDVTGTVRIQGDFINQDMQGLHGSSVQNVPFTNGVFNALNGTVTSVTISDGNGVNNSSVLVVAQARIFGGNLVGGTSSMGGYFLILQRDVSNTFSSPTNLTYTSGDCYIRTPNGVGSAAIGYGGGGSICYIDNALSTGTYYYRLVLYPNGVSITSGTYDVYERDVVVTQIKR